MDQIHVVGLSGSLREGGFTRQVVEIALEGAAEVGATVELVDLHDLDLPFCDGRKSYDEPGVGLLKKKLEMAKGVILGTPEYHGSFSGVLKNALDLMGFPQFAGKMMGLVGVSGGSIGATQALLALRTVGRQLHSWVIPEQVSIPEAWKHFREGELDSEQLVDRLQEVGKQVARFAYLHHSDDALAFMQAWEGAPHNPGA